MTANAAMKKSLRARVTELSRGFDPDPAHAVQVTKLSLRIFDELEAFHHLGPHERMILEIAAMLHDIGWSRPETKGHNKHSRDMILAENLPGMDDDGRLMCALIARYHRKAVPDADKHKRFASLDGPRRDAVEWLAGILRIADGLDRSHLSRIALLRCEDEGGLITFCLSAPTGSGVDIWGAERKMGLLQRKLGKDIVFSICE
jgi:exopolyphosphatase/guanosine-5'-triphosphate,3'-diphosphate pyrophosphatase